MAKNDVLKNRVKELRSRLDMRQADLAREIGVTRQTILAIEKGRLNPSINIALKAARVLREPVDYVFYLDHTAEDVIISSLGNGHAEAKNADKAIKTAAVWDFSTK